MSIKAFFSGLSLLRDWALVQDLGERRFHLQSIAEIRSGFPTSKIHRNVILVGYQKEFFEVGNGASICEGTVLAFGDSRNGLGCIRVGEHSWIGQYNNLRAGGGDILIGRGCLVSQFCSLVASNHGVEKNQSIQMQGPGTKRGVVLEDDVWLGAGVSVLPGVTVGKGAVVGAGSVVIRDIPPFEIWAGVPATKIGVRE